MRIQLPFAPQPSSARNAETALDGDFAPRRSFRRRTFLAGSLIPFLYPIAQPAAAVETSAHAQEEDPLPNRKPLPRVEVVPLPYDQLSVQSGGEEMVRYHFGPGLRRPFWFPLIGPGGRSYTRMGHPHDPVGHGHHNSVWISHADVDGVNFWADSAPGRILHDRIESLEDGQDSASVTVSCRWVDTSSNRTLLLDRRRWVVRLGRDSEWYFRLEIELSAPPGTTTTLRSTAFGILGVRVAKSISVADGGGRILNSEGHRDEKGCFRQPARWVDYSGPVLDGLDGGITLMDHPANPSFPTPFHVRDDGWMCPAVSLSQPIAVGPGEKKTFRYCLWVHQGVPNAATIEAEWQAFAAP